MCLCAINCVQFSRAYDKTWAGVIKYVVMNK